MSLSHCSRADRGPALLNYLLAFLTQLWWHASVFKYASKWNRNIIEPKWKPWAKMATDHVAKWRGTHRRYESLFHFTIIWYAAPWKQRLHGHAILSKMALCFLVVPQVLRETQIRNCECSFVFRWTRICPRPEITVVICLEGMWFYFCVIPKQNNYFVILWFVCDQVK